MRGAWRPYVLFGALPLVLGLGLFVAGRATWGVVAAMVLGTLPIVVLVSALGAVRGGRFLKGLQEAGEVVDVERDEVDWGGERTIVVRGLHGPWRIAATTGRNSRVDVLGPGDALPWRVPGDELKAARLAAERAAGGGQAAPPPKVVTPARLVVHVAGFYGLFVVLGLVFAGPRGAAWTAAVAAPFFLGLAWKAARRGRPLLQDTSGRVLEP